MTNKISDQFSGAIVCQQKTDLKQPTLPYGLGLRLFAFLPTTFFEIALYETIKYKGCKIKLTRNKVKRQ